MQALLFTCFGLMIAAAKRDSITVAMQGHTHWVLQLLQTAYAGRSWPLLLHCCQSCRTMEKSILCLPMEHMSSAAVCLSA